MTTSNSDSLPDQVDMLVAGSGATGLVAALTGAVNGLSVLMIEAGEGFGGTTALGGGRVWIPANGTEANKGDTVDNALRYLTQIFDTNYQSMIEAFATTAPAMARFVEEHSPHRFVNCPNYPDYHQDLEGATAGGRAFDVAPVSLADLAPEASKVIYPPGYLPTTHAEWESWRYPQFFDREVIEQRRRDSVITNGSGLVAALIDGVVRAGGDLSTTTRLVDVVVDDDRTVTGAVVERDGKEMTIRASSVMMASGGYDADPDLRKSLLPEPLGASASIPTNRGTALEIARHHGIAVDNLGQGWWMPMMQVGDEIDDVPYPRALVRERGVPHQIAVNGAGERFVDEACPYNEFGKAVHKQAADGSYPNRMAFLIFDEQFRRRYPLPGLTTSGELASHFSSAPTLAELGDAIGIDGSRLEDTAQRWNRDCAKGVDPDFGRGDNVYDRYYGDPSVEPNPNLGPVSEPPFYATAIITATIGSKGGPVTTTDAAVLRNDGSVIQGIYAAGNAAAFWTGDGYPGPGATLAVGMTFGYRGALAEARRQRKHGLLRNKE